jgi:hypothetical protein
MDRSFAIGKERCGCIAGMMSYRQVTASKLPQISVKSRGFAKPGATG